MTDMEAVLEQIFGDTSQENAEIPTMQDEENINGDAPMGEQCDNEEHGAYECIPNCDESIKPYLGQPFSTLDEGVRYYKEYAAFVGFDVRASTMKKNRNGDVEVKYLLCSREGYTVTKAQRGSSDLSPYLFINVAESLSEILRVSEADGALHGICVARGALRISHLFSVDDCLFFFRENSLEAGCINEILREYGQASGRK
nr:FAR1 DNA-binding domain protein [Ipomoea batatas]